jgi:hypothetical protein
MCFIAAGVAKLGRAGEVLIPEVPIQPEFPRTAICGEHVWKVGFTAASRLAATIVIR